VKKRLMLGIDEAGMGPVFGPLVISGVVIDADSVPFLEKIGVKDSKKFGAGETARKKRREVWETSKDYIIAEKRIIISAEELDRANMYDLHVTASRQILRFLKWPEVKDVFIEQIGMLGRDKYFSMVGFWHSGFCYEQKADEKYIPVSLASIGAKVMRDQEIENLCKSAGEEFVSGYANNTTEEFFRRYYKKNGCLPPGTRVSRKWAPLQEMLREIENELK